MKAEIKGLYEENIRESEEERKRLMRNEREGWRTERLRKKVCQ